MRHTLNAQNQYSTRLTLINSKSQIYELINCLAQNSTTLILALAVHSVILLYWTDRPLLVRRVSGRITMLMSVRQLVMEALASSNMAHMPLINVIENPLTA